MSSHSSSDAPGVLRLFVYGTLKRGYWNHEAYCGSAISIEEATVRGRLYELPSGIPVLLVPRDDTLGDGSGCVFDDIVQQDMAVVRADDQATDGWDEVCGELITLQDPDRTLPPLDRLEGFTPGGISLYRRVLVPIRLRGSQVVSAWTYVRGDTSCPGLKLTRKNRWP